MSGLVLAGAESGDSRRSSRVCALDFRIAMHAGLTKPLGVMMK